MLRRVALAPEGADSDSLFSFVNLYFCVLSPATWFDRIFSNAIFDRRSDGCRSGGLGQPLVDVSDGRFECDDEFAREYAACNFDVDVGRRSRELIDSSPLFRCCYAVVVVHPADCKITSDANHGSDAKTADHYFFERHKSFLV